MEEEKPTLFDRIVTLLEEHCTEYNDIRFTLGKDKIETDDDVIKMLTDIIHGWEQCSG